MHVGLALPQFDYSVPGESPLRWETLLGWAEHADGLGFDSLWLADHLFLSIDKYGAPPGEHGGFDAVAALGGLALRTRHARIGTLVVCAQLRPPAVLAKALATVDVLAGGRLVVGIGAGWFEPEYAAAGIPFERPGVRLEQLAEAVQIVRDMLGGEPLDFAGRHYRADGARCRPPSPQRPAPPVWVGGRGDRLLDVCARHADGWNTVWTWTPEDYRARLRVLDAACERAGRDPATLTRSVGLYTLVGEDRRDLARRFDRLRRCSPPGVLDGTTLDEWRRGHLVGTVEEVAEQVQAWEELGVHTLIACVGAVPFAVTVPEDVEMLASACRLEMP